MSMSQPSHMQSRITWTNAPTRSVDVAGTKLVYRQLGAENGVPVIFLNHLAAELDSGIRGSSTALHPGAA